ncbi:MAG TPA: ABC transporter permease [Gemmatimonadaceae bacterium]|nr:ABC transporter permease [Gemmatimonadaceae bacterium]
MPMLEQIRFWLRGLFLRRRAESELEKEMRLHLDLEIENNVRLGMSPDAARRAALVAFGGVESAKEGVRDERPLRWLEHAAGDVRFALRGFRKNPGFALAVIVLIALGVGANAAIFSVINHVMLRPIPFHDGNRMVEFVATGSRGMVLIEPLRSDIDQWRARAHAVDRVTLVRQSQFEFGDSTRGALENLSGAMITPGMSAFTGMHPLFGRDIASADTLSDAPLVALLGYGFWQRHFGGARAVIGRAIWLNGQLHTVIGVVPRGFGVPFIDGDQIFTALRSTGPNQVVDAIGKLRNGVSIEEANRELAAIVNQARAPSDRLHSTADRDIPKLVRGIDLVNGDLKRTLLLMFGAVWVVLLIACANVANLAMVHAWSRQREFAIRTAIGAGRGRLVRQVVTECMLLSMIGGGCGLAIAMASTRLMVRSVPRLTDVQDIHVDGIVIGWALSIALCTGLLFSSAPAVWVAGQRAVVALKAGARAAGTSRTARRFRAALIVVEIALSVVLLAGAGLLVRTLIAMQRADVGMDPSGLIGVSIRLTDPKLTNPMDRRAALRAALDEIRKLPQVEGAALAMTLPPDFGLGLGGVQIEGRTSAAGDSLGFAAVNASTGNLFSLSRIRLLRGRAFTDDRSAGDLLAGNEVVVNESFAQRFWPGSNAIGKRIKTARTWATIVGIARDVRVPGARRANLPQIYERTAGAPPFGTIVVRSTLPMATLVPRITQAVHTANPFIKIGDAKSADATIANARELQRIVLVLLGTFAGLALVITAFGLHAVIAYAVGQRTREIGVRVALGAQAADISRLVFGQGLALTSSGLMIGVAAALAATRSLRGMLYGVQPTDAATITAVAIVLGIVALAASYTPARRAGRIDPIDALKSE